MVLQLKAARQGKLLTQFDLARKVGTSESRISRLETGRVKPTESEKRRLSDFLGVPSFELFTEVRR